MKREYDTTPDQEIGLQHATDVYNEKDGPEAHRQAEANLPEDERTEYVPFTVADYFDFILDRTFSDYAVQKITADKESIARKFSSADAEDRAKLKAAVDAVQVKPKG